MRTAALFVAFCENILQSIAIVVIMEPDPFILLL